MAAAERRTSKIEIRDLLNQIRDLRIPSVTG